MTGVLVGWADWLAVAAKEKLLCAAGCVCLADFRQLEQQHPGAVYHGFCQQICGEIVCGQYLRGCTGKAESMGASGAAAGCTSSKHSASQQVRRRCNRKRWASACRVHSKAPAALPPGPGCPRLRPLYNIMRQSWAVAGLCHNRQHFAVPTLGSAFVCRAKVASWAAAYISFASVLAAALLISV